MFVRVKKRGIFAPKARKKVSIFDPNGRKKVGKTAATNAPAGSKKVGKKLRKSAAGAAPAPPKNLTTPHLSRARPLSGVTEILGGCGGGRPAALSGASARLALP